MKKKLIVEDKLVNLFKKLFNINLINEAENEMREIIASTYREDSKKISNKEQLRKLYIDTIQTHL